MKNKIFLLLTSALFFILFVFFTLAVRADLMTKFDFDTMVKIQNHIPRRADAFLSLMANLGSVEISLIFLVIFLILQKKLRGFLVLGLFFLMHGFELIGKFILYQPGPQFQFYRKALGVNLPADYAAGASYPSGHAMRMVFLSFFISLMIIRSKKTAIKILWTIILFTLTSLILIAKVVLGHHWVSDIIGGTLVGTSFGILSSFIFQL